MPPKWLLSVLTPIVAMATALLVVAAFGGAGGKEAKHDRREYLENLSLAEQEQLRHKRETFESFDEAEQQRMRDLHAAIIRSPDSEQLQDVMRQYHQWLKTLTGQQRAELLSMPPDERIDEIKTLLDEQRQQRFRDLVKTLAPEDGRVIFGWMDQYAANHEEELLALLPETTRQRLAATPNVPGPIQRMRLLMALGNTPDDQPLPAPTDEEIRKLHDELSDQANAALDKMPTRERKLELVREWVRAAVASRMAPQVSRERLLEFYRRYREQPENQRHAEELDRLPPDELYEELKKIYFRNRGPWRGRWDGPRRGGRDRDGERDGRGDGHNNWDRRRDDDRRRPDADGRPLPEEGPPDRRRFGPGGPRERIGDAVRQRLENGPRLRPPPPENEPAPP